MYLLQNFSEALDSFKNMQIDTRTSLFYSAVCHKLLGNLDLSSEKLEIAKAESGMDIKKFVATQLYQNPAISKNLIANLSEIETASN